MRLHGVIAALGAAMALGTQGCGTEGAGGLAGRGSSGPGLIEPVESRVDAVTGMTLIMPVTLHGAVTGGSDQDQNLGITLDDRTPLRSVLRWITVQAGEDASEAGGARWLPPQGRWRTWDHAPPDGALAMTVLAVDLPLQAAGKDLLIGTRRVRLNWLPSPAFVVSDPAVTLKSPLPPGVRDSVSLTDLTRPERLSPVRRWRYRLLASGLDPATAPPSITGEPRAFVDAVLEALASQYEARWTVALGLLAKSDLRLAQQLTLRLCSIVRFTDATVAPVWETDQSELEDLLADLLDPAVGAEGHARRAQAWLDRQPPAVVWPIDPEGDSAGSARLPIATIGIANLSGTPLLASSVWLDQVGHEIGPRPELASLASHAWAELKAATPKDAVATSRSTQGDDVHSATLAIHCGESQQRLTIPVDPLSAAPPSLALGPLLGDLMLATFQSGSRGVPIEPAWSTTALLYRGPVDGSSPEEAVRTGGWTLYVQCSRAEDPPRAGDSPPAADSIRIIAGPRSSPRMILRVDETGRVEREDDRGNTGASVPARVSREPSRWLALVQIPPDAIEDDGILRIGLERFDARGVHSAWPRASLPWQETPARTVINLAAWER